MFRCLPTIRLRSQVFGMRCPVGGGACISLLTTSGTHALRRAKNGTPATHPLSGREMRELRRHHSFSVRQGRLAAPHRMAGGDTNEEPRRPVVSGERPGLR